MTRILTILAVSAPFLAVLLIFIRIRSARADWSELEEKDREELDSIPWTGSGFVFRDGDTVRHVPIYRLRPHQKDGGTR